MKNLMKCLSVLAVMSSTVAMAAKVEKIEVFPPYLSVGCSNFNTDSAGKIGSSLVKLSSSESEANVTLSVENQLKVCKVTTNAEGVKSLAWENINPYLGYEVQYYDFETNSIQTRKEKIESDSKANRFEVALYAEDRNVSFKKPFLQLNSNQFVGTLEMKKLDLLNQNDLDLMDSGKTVKKIVTLMEVLNVTTSIKGQVLEMGDQSFSGRNVAISFVKKNQAYKVSSLALVP